MRSRIAFCLGLCLSFSICTTFATAQDAVAEKPKTDAGQGDLDEAVILRIDAASPEELAKVSGLLKSAVKKGLSDENNKFAKKMLGSILFQEAQETAAQIVRSRGQNLVQLRDEAVVKLKEAVKHDPQLVEAYLLLARMNMTPGGDKSEIQYATGKAIELLKDDPVEKSAALVLRALTYDIDEDEKRLKDLDEAVAADPKNMEALQARAAMRMKDENVEGAIKDLQAILLEDPTNLAVAETAVRQLVELNRVEDALSLVSNTLKANPNEGMYRMRAILYRMEGEEDKALEDLNKALDMQPRDPMSLLQRAEIALGRQDIAGAKRDLRSASRLAPQIANLDQAIFVRCLIAIEEKRMADAINDMQVLVDRDPTNITRQMQLANLYTSDNRPRKSIEILSNVLDRDPANISIIRSRADARLAIGDHKKAIADYEAAIKLMEAEDEKDAAELAGLMNNLAWVLATSPTDDVRNGKRAVELGVLAVKYGEEALAEATTPEEKKERSIAHILSTLAAAYAEVGDFDKAIQWSTKSVNEGKKHEHHQLDQLQKELDSYKKGEAWREKQETKENAVPILSPEDLIEA